MQATTTYAYDPNGNLLSETDPDGHTTWTTYDALNRPVRSVSTTATGRMTRIMRPRQRMTPWAT